jgi:shikimate kinase
MSERNIVLTGFMATGKTTVGQIVAIKLGRVFYDVDTAIEHRTGLTIPRIFAEHSEPFFRAIEKGICHEIALQKNLVVATGGGAIIDDDNRDALLKTSFVVCLSASPEIIEARLLKFDLRPLAGKWRELLEKRSSIYEALPNCIDTSEKTPEQVAEEVLILWQNASA